MRIRRLTTAIALASLLALALLFREPAIEKPKPGETPLILAAKRGDTKLVKSLLEQGADPYRVTPEGRNAMDYAALGGVCQVPTVIALKEKSPNLQFQEPSRLWRNVEVVKLKGCVLLGRAKSLW